MRIRDWSSDVCSSDLSRDRAPVAPPLSAPHRRPAGHLDRLPDPERREATPFNAGAAQIKLQHPGRRVQFLIGKAERPPMDGNGGDRKSGVEGKSVDVRVDAGGRRGIQKKNNIKKK